FTFNLSQTPGNQQSTLGTGSETVTGSLLITRSDNNGELSSLASLNIPTLTIGNTQYTFSNPMYAPPTVNSIPGSAGDGKLGIEIDSVLVPEPSTLALLTLGAVGLLLRRRFASV